MSGQGWFVDMTLAIALWCTAIISLALLWIAWCYRPWRKRPAPPAQVPVFVQPRKRAPVHVGAFQPQRASIEDPDLERTICDQCGHVHLVAELYAARIRGVDGRLCETCMEGLGR